jgi:hypothetical protein
MKHNGFRGFPIASNARGFAVGILYGSKQGEAILWAETHYSTFVMASNLALLSLLSFLYVAILLICNWCTLLSGFSWLAISAGLIFVFSSLALDRYLYAYQVAFRQAMVMLTEERKAGPAVVTAGLAEEAQKPAVAPDGMRRR